MCVLSLRSLWYPLSTVVYLDWKVVPPLRNDFTTWGGVNAVDPKCSNSRCSGSSAVAKATSSRRRSTSSLVRKNSFSSHEKLKVAENQVTLFNVHRCVGEYLTCSSRNEHGLTNTRVFKYPSRRTLLWFFFSSSWILDKDSPIKLIIYYSLSKQLYFEVIEANLNVLWCYDVRAANTIGIAGTGCFNQKIVNYYFPIKPDFWSHGAICFEVFKILKYFSTDFTKLKWNTL